MICIVNPPLTNFGQNWVILASLGQILVGLTSLGHIWGFLTNSTMNFLPNRHILGCKSWSNLDLLMTAGCTNSTGIVKLGVKLWLIDLFQNTQSFARITVTEMGSITSVSKI